MTEGQSPWKYTVFVSSSTVRFIVCSVVGYDAIHGWVSLGNPVVSAGVDGLAAMLWRPVLVEVGAELSH